MYPVFLGSRLAISEKQDQLCHHRRLPTIILQINALSLLKFATDSPPSRNYFHHLSIIFLFGSRKDKLNQLKNNQSSDGDDKKFCF